VSVHRHPQLTEFYASWLSQLKLSSFIKVGQGSEHPDPGEYVPARCRGSGWMASKGPCQPKAFYGSFDDSMKDIVGCAALNQSDENTTSIFFGIFIKSCLRH